MAQKSVTGYLIDIEAGFYGKKTLNGTLQGYYDALRCSCIDITPRTIGGEEFAVYCDDEGLLKDCPVPSAFTEDCRPQLVGNLFIARVNAEGETISLTSSEIETIGKQIRIGVFSMKAGIAVRPFLLVQ